MDSTRTAVPLKEMTDCDFTRLPNGLIVSTTVQIWPISMDKVRQWMGEVKLDAENASTTSYIKLRCVCKSKWKSLWKCRGAHNSIKPGDLRYLQVEFPEPALVGMRLYLHANSIQVPIQLEKMQGSDNFLWGSVGGYRKRLAHRSREESVSSFKRTNLKSLRERMKEMNNVIPSQFISPTLLSSSHSRSSNGRRHWGENVGSLRLAHETASVNLSVEFAASFIPSAGPPRMINNDYSTNLLRDFITNGYSSSSLPLRTLLFTLIHPIVQEKLNEIGENKAEEVLTTMEENPNVSTPFADEIIDELAKNCALKKNQTRDRATSECGDSTEEDLDNTLRAESRVKIGEEKKEEEMEEEEIGQAMNF